MTTYKLLPVDEAPDIVNVELEGKIIGCIEKEGETSFSIWTGREPLYVSSHGTLHGAAEALCAHHAAKPSGG